jgi:nitrogen PTS system EIIA component
LEDGSSLPPFGRARENSSFYVEDFSLNTIASYLSQEDILLDIAVSSKAQLFQAIGQHMERVHTLRQDWVVESLTRREMAGSTGLGQGFAIPHARVPGLDRIRVVYMRLKSPIPFDAPDGRPVSEVLVLLVPSPATGKHLRILADAAQMFSDGQFREQIGQCGDPAEIKRIFDAWPEKMVSGRIA